MNEFKRIRIEYIIIYEWTEQIKTWMKTSVNLSKTYINRALSSKHEWFEWKQRQWLIELMNEMNEWTNNE